MADSPNPLQAGLTWLDARLGFVSWLREVLATPMPGRARLGRVSAAVVVGAFALQALTGFGLANYYAPGTTSAWASVAHVEDAVLLGSFLRGLHVYGASLIVVLLLLYLVERAWRLDFGGRLGWWLALGLVPLISAFSLTGYLLPWDQRGYWSTQVSTSLAGATPFVGPAAQRVVQGGTELGQLTLTRAYSAHTILLPLLLCGLFMLYLRVWRREAKVSPPEESEPYWPRFAARDGIALLIGVGVVALLAGGVGGHLEAPADPEVDFAPRPEWYFMALRQLLEYAPEPIGSHVLPGVAFFVWAGLPWLGEKRRLLARILVTCTLGLWVVLLGIGFWADHTSPRFQKLLVSSAERATLARRLARDGVPPEGAAEQVRNHPPVRGAQLFAQECARCHSLQGLPLEGPHLKGYLSTEWLAGVIKEPRHPSYFGQTKIDDMEPLAEDALGDLPSMSVFVRSLDPSVKGLDPAEVAKGRKAYFEQGCGACHSIKPRVEELGPNLYGYGSPTWLREFLENPGADHLYCETNEMPRYNELPSADLDALVVYLRMLDGDPYPPDVASVTSQR
ncbi:MAG: cytochrome b N-terminal domain-containing protein [Planctomycetes bacterium]|nr:cytochrome b N-terminal domain-containing protein [Planctomycetota bacterium]